MGPNKFKYDEDEDLFFDGDDIEEDDNLWPEEETDDDFDKIDMNCEIFINTAGMIKFLIIFISIVFLNGCYSTSNSEAYGALKIQETTETSTYMIFGFGMIKVVKPVNADVEIVRDYGIGTQCITSTRSGMTYSLGAWGNKTTSIKPDSGATHENFESIFNDSIIINKE